MTMNNEGLTSWQKPGNHDRMAQLQSGVAAIENVAVEVAYFGHSAVRITSQSGISVLIDPWRNHPAGGKWFFNDFPVMAVDIGICTHAHFDHDALHRLDAHMLIDRLIGYYRFADIEIIGFADRHATSPFPSKQAFKSENRNSTSANTLPPDSRRSRDNCLTLVETGGLRLLHWGDNRANLPDHLWEILQDLDVLFLPLDASQHIITYEMAETIMERLKPRIIVPIHYYIENVTRKRSTLLSPEEWLNSRANVTRSEMPLIHLNRETLGGPSPRVCYFGDNVAFDVPSWRSAAGSEG